MPLRVDSPELGWWLRLHGLPRAGGRTRVDLLEAFGSIETLFAASKAQLERALPDKPETVAAILDNPDAGRVESARQWLMQDSTRHLVVWTDADYPPLLREIPDPPIALYVLGARAALTRPQLAIVGSRNPTPVGIENARALARALAQAGLTVTSGLALGVDGAAHRGALEAGGATIAICGTGLDRVYPARHRALAHAIANNGALVSEFALGTPPRPEHFPIRNRLISGLALGVLVVEAALESGSLITARLALEQGREVFAIPGSIHSPQSRGCHVLIRQGAKLVETANDVLEELGALAMAATELGDVQKRTSVAGDRMSGATALAQFARTSAATPATTASVVLPAAAHLLDCLGHDPATLDALVERSGLTADVVSSMLGALELEGRVAALPGGWYQRLP